MSDTLETDAEASYPDSSLGECVDADFARKLERERDEAREKAERYRLEANALMMQRDEAREQNAKLRDIAEWFANQFFENDGDERWPSCPVTKKSRRLLAELEKLKEGAK